MIRTHLQQAALTANPKKSHFTTGLVDPLGQESYLIYISVCISWHEVGLRYISFWCMIWLLSSSPTSFLTTLPHHWCLTSVQHHGSLPCFWIMPRLALSISPIVLSPDSNILPQKFYLLANSYALLLSFNMNPQNGLFLTTLPKRGH